MRGHVTLQNPERFCGDYHIDESKIKSAIEKACAKLLANAERYMDGFPANHCAAESYKYNLVENNSWICGMLTGCYLLAYEFTHNSEFLEVAKHHMASYRKRIDEKTTLQDHDVGFVFSPSSVALYKLTGDSEALDISIAAAKHLYDTGYSEKGGFILRAGTRADQPWACRTMMDSLLNAPLLFWAGEQLGEDKYTKAGLAQSKITDTYLAREDGSTFHHYQFEVGTHLPMHGLTLQGASADSCWSRGHAWGVLGLPIAYAYTGAQWLMPLHRDITYFMLNHLPDDNIPYWDFDFTSGDEPRDSSAGVISVCGLLEMLKYLSEDAPERQIYQNAAALILESVIDNCTKDIGKDYDGLITHVTAAKPQGEGINGCALYGDYFYLEALMRYINPSWKMYW